MIAARVVVAVVVVLLVAMAPSPVWALCPNCLGQADSLTARCAWSACSCSCRRRCSSRSRLRSAA